MNTIFHKIIAKEVKADVVYEDEKMLVFKDIKPQAKVHVLAIPKKFIKDLDDIDGENIEYITHIFQNIPKVVKLLSLDRGYRVISNCKEYQEVPYLHFHILGGN